MKKALFAAILSVPLMASAQNLVSNGSFESVLAGSWNLSGFGLFPPARITYGAPGSAFGEVIPTDPLAPAGSPDGAGLWALYFVDDTAAQAVSQSFNLVGGTTYKAGFDYYQTNNGSVNPNNAFLTTAVTAVSNNVAATSTVVSLAAAPVGSWIQVTNTFTPAASGNYTFSFVFASLGAPAKDIVVDRAFVTAIPEPETYGMMLAGLLAVAAIVRRRGFLNH